MKKYILLLQFAIVLSGFIPASAQRFIVNAPSQVSVGENFRLVYTIDTQNAKDFRVGNIPEALELITGPYYRLFIDNIHIYIMRCKKRYIHHSTGTYKCKRENLCIEGCKSKSFWRKPKYRRCSTYAR